MLGLLRYRPEVGGKDPILAALCGCRDRLRAGEEMVLALRAAAAEAGADFGEVAYWIYRMVPLRWRACHGSGSKDAEKIAHDLTAYRLRLSPEEVRGLIERAIGCRESGK